MLGFVTAFESGTMATEAALLRLFFGWMFFQIWTRGVLAENTGVFYRNIDLGDSYPGFAITSEQPGSAMLLINAGDQNNDGYGDFLMAPQGGYYPVTDLSTTVALRYGRPSLQNTVIPYSAASDQTLHGSFGVKNGFCGMTAPLSNANAHDLVYALRSQNYVNIRFSNQGSLNAHADDLSIVSSDVISGCPITLGYLSSSQPEIIESWGQATIVATRGPFTGISGTLLTDFTAGNNRSASFTVGNSPYGKNYPMQYASLGAVDGALFVSSYDVSVGGKSFVGEIRVLKRDPSRFGPGGFFAGWDATIRCTQDSSRAQNCGQALAIGNIANKKAMATSWVDPDQGGVKVALIYDIAQLLANTQPIILENHLDGQQGILIFGDSSKVSVPTALGLDFANIRSNNNADLVLRTPYNNPGIFVLFPDQLSGATVNLNTLNGYNGFTIKGKTQRLTNFMSFVEAIGESAIFSSTPDCQNMVFTNTVPSGYLSLAQGLPFSSVNTAVYVLNCHDLRETVSPTPTLTRSTPLSASSSPSPLRPAPLPSSSAQSISTSALQTTPLSESPSPSADTALLSPASNTTWTDHPEYLALAGLGGTLLLATGLILKRCQVLSKNARHDAVHTSRDAFFAEKDSDVELTKREIHFSDDEWLSYTGSSESSPTAPKLVMPEKPDSPRLTPAAAESIPIQLDVAKQSPTTAHADTQPIDLEQSGGNGSNEATKISVEQPPEARVEKNPTIQVDTREPEVDIPNKRPEFNVPTRPVQSVNKAQRQQTLMPAPNQPVTNRPTFSPASRQRPGG